MVLWDMMHPRDGGQCQRNGNSLVAVTPLAQTLRNWSEIKILEEHGISCC